MKRYTWYIVIALLLTGTSVSDACAQWPNQRALEARRQREHEIWLQEEALRTQQRMVAEMQLQRQLQWQYEQRQSLLPEPRSAYSRLEQDDVSWQHRPAEVGTCHDVYGGVNVTCRIEMQPRDIGADYDAYFKSSPMRHAIQRSREHRDD